MSPEADPAVRPVRMAIPEPASGDAAGLSRRLAYDVAGRKAAGSALAAPAAAGAAAPSCNG